MKTISPKRAPCLSLLCLVVGALGPQVRAQTPSGVELQLHPGLKITGAVGAVFSVEYVTDLAQTNDWRSLIFLRLPATNQLWVDPTAATTSRRFYRAVSFVAPTNMVFIPPGPFRMGSPTNEADRYGDEGPQMEVTISRGFWMGKYEVTQGEYLAVTGTNPSWFNGPRQNFPQPESNTDFGFDLSRPVEQVSWFDATNYCGVLTRRERAAGRIAHNSVYRLPTEAEWEYACRAWTSTRFGYGEDLGYTNLTNYAWYDANSGSSTHPVGQKLPNAWGLYDMNGNVFEWCQDWFGPYLGGIALDPQGPATGSEGVALGGSWDFSARECRSAFRLIVSASGPGPESRYNFIGFRVLLAPGQP